MHSRWDHCEHNSIPHTQEIQNCGYQGCRIEWEGRGQGLCSEGLQELPTEAK